MEKNYRILVVDDDPDVRESYQLILAPGEKEILPSLGKSLFSDIPRVDFTFPRPPYEVTAVKNGEAGVAAVKEAVTEGRPFAVAFVDMKMPGIDGAETARRMWIADPSLLITIVTAYSETPPDKIVNITGRDDLLYLRKPFAGEEIRQFARCLTTQWHLSRERDLMAHRLEEVNANLEHLVRKRTHHLNESKEELNTTLTRLRKALGAIIEALAAVVETKDPYTAGHQHRVADLARAIATEMGLTGDQVDGIRLAASIHDIGKIRVPSEILNRPGKILDPEMEIIKCHPEAGYDVLKGIDFPWPVAEIALQHHEREDGNGYPRGLKDEEGLVEAKVLAVADVVDAMASHRPYRPALGIESALSEIEKGRGTRYHPDVVDACLKLFREKNFEFKP
ncbi:MAG: HD domain-containing protein [Deltaproteobacteria bacterium]|nr:HD domain-containing protein [Deltaproteobacteria bacterium]